MALVSFNPIEDLLQLQRELEQVLRNPLFDLGPSAPGVFPPVNVFADGEALVVRAEVPGVDPSDLHVQIERGTLTISGERKPPQEAEKGSYHRRERAYGRFSRALRVPDDLDPDRATAVLNHGILTVRIPKREEAKPRTIQVQAG